MTEFVKCSICGTFTFLGDHTCPPKWLVRIHPDDDHYPGHDEPGTAYASDPRDAAMSWATEWDTDRVLTEDGSITVLVSRHSDPDNAWEVVVRGTMRPAYYIEHVERA